MAMYTSNKHVKFVRKNVLPTLFVALQHNIIIMNVTHVTSNENLKKSGLLFRCVVWDNKNHQYVPMYKLNYFIQL